MMLDEWGALAAYHRMCEVLGEIPDPDVWSDKGATLHVDHKLGRLEWFEVLDLLEETASGVDDRAVKEVFARSGLAYEMVDGTIHLFDPEGEALQVASSETLSRAAPALSSQDRCGDGSNRHDNDGRPLRYMDASDDLTESCRAAALHRLAAISQLGDSVRPLGDGGLGTTSSLSPVPTVTSGAPGGRSRCSEPPGNRRERVLPALGIKVPGLCQPLLKAARAWTQGPRLR